MNVLHGTTALAVSATICHASFCIASALGQPAMHIPIITAVTVTLATVLPQLEYWSDIDGRAKIWCMCRMKTRAA
jgi:hypothetical protein